MISDRLIEQAEIINTAHALTPLVQHHSQAWGGCIIQRWRGFLGEYEIPSLTYPIITIISGGRAKIKRIGNSNCLSLDHAMPGDIALIPRNQGMSWRVNGDMDVIAITFCSDQINNHLQDIYNHIADKISDANYVGSFSNSYLFTNANHLSNVLLSPNQKSAAYVDAHLQSIGLYINQFFGKKDDGLTEFQLHSHPVNYTVQRLSLGISNKINIEDIAAELRISPAFLTKKFKQEVGITPHTFLLHKRIQKAQTLLANTNMDIASIAVDCGFSHQSHLTRHFSKFISISPLKFRQQAKKHIADFL
jgi:AraC family transcriptional regulator